MSFSHVLTRTSNDGVAAVTGSETVTAGASPGISELIPAPSTNLQVAFAFTNAKLKSICIYSAVDMTVYTNDASTGSPQETIHLLAGIPFLWSSTQSYIGASNPSPFAGNVTSIYVTLGGLTDSTLNIRAIVDPT